MNEIVFVGKHATTYTVPLHAHDSWELIYCTGGDGKFYFRDQTLTYSSGDIVIVPPFTPHSTDSATGFTNIHINMVETVLNFNQPIVISDDADRSLFSAFSGAYFHFYENSDFRHTLLSEYGNLIAALVFANQKTIPLSHVVQQIGNDIMRNYTDCNYALDDHLRSYPYSYDYLRKLFQKEVGVTPQQYLNDKRLQTAANMLSSKYNNSNISEIAHLCGFRESLYFSRMFKKKYGVSPSQYYAEQASLSDHPLPDTESMKIKLPEKDA